ATQAALATNQLRNSSQTARHIHIDGVLWTIRVDHIEWSDELRFPDSETARVRTFPRACARFTFTTTSVPTSSKTFPTALEDALQGPRLTASNHLTRDL